jgi:hypothetical protein
LLQHFCWTWDINGSGIINGRRHSIECGSGVLQYVQREGQSEKSGVRPMRKTATRILRDLVSPAMLPKRRPAGQRPGRIRSAIEQVFSEGKVGQRQLWTICPGENGCWHAQVEHLAELLQSATTPRFDPHIARRTGADRKNRDAALIVAFRRLAPFLTGCSTRTSWVFLPTSGPLCCMKGTPAPGKD